MRFLGIGETNDLGDMYLRLKSAGHDVRVHMSDENSAGVMDGMLTFSDDSQRDFSWIRDAGPNGVIIFETASAGLDQDRLRLEGFNVIGGSSLGDRLETDRQYGQRVLRELGLQTACSREFSGFNAGLDFLHQNPGRYVFKLNGSNWPSTRNYVGQMDNSADMIALLRATRDAWSLDEEPDFILMDFVDGVEVGVGAFFNGARFLDPPNLDWEHKRFFPGDIGELTGEMGTVVTYRQAGRIFDATLAKLAPLLAESRYCGYVNLNTIINERGIWPLEFTCRFGYPGFAILDSLHVQDWGRLLADLASGTAERVETRDGFAVGVVLTVPSFPYSDGYAELGKGMPISFRETMTGDDHASLHFGEVAMNNEQLVTAGMIGYTMVVTGTGKSIGAARIAAYETVGKVVIPNCRFRNDIGSRLIESDWTTLVQLGWLT
ncbi:MAG: phosphoribosylglycinamide synthetase C domain-containing protein [Gemmatimonadaceae bacterium]